MSENIPNHHNYKAFGITIASEITLPELFPGKGKPEAIIKYGRVDVPSELADAIEGHWCIPGGVGLIFKGAGSFLIRNGCEIIVSCAPETEERRLRLFILGAALAALLHQRGLLVFHASAVSSNESGIIFLGSKGGGKSTLAARMHIDGFNFISDDVVAVKLDDNNQPWILPGFPQLKLWPDTVLSMGENPEDLDFLTSRLPKRHRPVTQGLISHPVPLKSVFHLSPGPELKMVSLGSREGIFVLLANLYATRYIDEVLAPTESRSFLHCAQITRKVKVCALQRPRDLSLLPKTVDLVKETTGIA